MDRRGRRIPGVGNLHLYIERADDCKLKFTEPDIAQDAVVV